MAPMILSSRLLRECKSSNIYNHSPICMSRFLLEKVGLKCHSGPKDSPRGFEKRRDHDEAHFWLNGYVNKQNCRISSEANPQVYVETPLHPEKLTVWWALWAGEILLQKR
ncbi:hypothetical protein TNCV_170701 [Trichonephila clavipes]|nr:hypothetical protein TNCV_170701 [Trichonephila clavipes]